MTAVYERKKHNQQISAGKGIRPLALEDAAAVERRGSRSSLLPVAVGCGSEAGQSSRSVCQQVLKNKPPQCPSCSSLTMQSRTI